MNLTEFIAAIESELGTVTHDPSVRMMEIEIEDTQEDLVKTIFGVKLENGRLRVVVG